jgi:hypothetical protein
LLRYSLGLELILMQDLHAASCSLKESLVPNLDSQIARTLSVLEKSFLTGLETMRGAEKFNYNVRRDP